MVDVIHARGIDDEVWKRFKQAVIAKYGKLHGVLGMALTEALRLYLRDVSSDGAHTHTKSNSKEPQKAGTGEASKVDMMYGRGHRVVAQIVSQLIDMGLWDGEELNQKVVERLIWKYAGMDSRTVRKYMEMVEDVWKYQEYWRTRLPILEAVNHEPEA